MAGRRRALEQFAFVELGLKLRCVRYVSLGAELRRVRVACRFNFLPHTLRFFGTLLARPMLSIQSDAMAVLLGHELYGGT